MSLRAPQPRQQFPAGPDAPGDRQSGMSRPARSATLARRVRARQGLARSIALFRLFLLEQTEPEVFYVGLAEDSANQVSRHTELAGSTVVDVGGGAGHFTAAFRARGANCYLFEPDSAELLSGGGVPAGAVLADGYWLPVADGSADV